MAGTCSCACSLGNCENRSINDDEVEDNSADNESDEDSD